MQQSNKMYVLILFDPCTPGWPLLAMVWPFMRSVRGLICGDRFRRASFGQLIQEIFLGTDLWGASLATTFRIDFEGQNDGSKFRATHSGMISGGQISGS